MRSHGRGVTSSSSAPAAVSDLVQHVAASTRRNDLLDGVARLLRQALNAEWVAVTRVSGADRCRVVADASNTWESQRGCLLTHSWNDPSERSARVGRVIGDGDRFSAGMPVVLGMIRVSGAPWGLVIAHRPNDLTPSEALQITELATEIVGIRLATLEMAERSRAEHHVRRLETLLADAISREGDWREPLLRDPAHLLEPVRATGAALITDGELRTVGRVPSRSAIELIRCDLRNREELDEVFSTNRLEAEWPDLAFGPVASRMLAVRLSSGSDDWLMWFRGGSPEVKDDSGSSCLDWRSGDRAFAAMVGASLADVILQFRTVQVLIVREQLRQIDENVRRSRQPAIVVDGAGRISLTNDGFRLYVGPDDWVGRPLEELAPRFVDPGGFLSFCRRLLDERRPCRTDLDLRMDEGERTPMLLRGDVVSAPDGRVFGTILILTDLSQRRVALDSRQRLERVIEGSQSEPLPIQPGLEPYARALDGLLDAAASAAVEVSRGLEASWQGSLIDELESSMLRSRALLDQLASRTQRSGSEGRPSIRETTRPRT
jgi:chemotaxis family two-component system sensor kinase Cph1